MPKKYINECISDYMRKADTRFTEICELYLENMTIDDLKYCHPNDLIGLVPNEQHAHKLLMIVMIRRYLFRDGKHLEINVECDKIEKKIVCGSCECNTESECSTQTQTSVCECKR
jgi:hypothetical protein